MDDIRARQQQAQRKAIAALPQPTYRIGDRDPVTGKYTMIYPDGSKVVGAEKVFSAQSQPGDRVLANQRTDGTWLLQNAGARRSRPRPSVSALPARERKRSQVWVLYDYDGGLWVGGHQAVPVRVCDRPAGLAQAYIWGDFKGWEVMLTRNGLINRPRSITSISSDGSRVDLDAPNAEFFPLGAGVWEVINKDKAFSPSDNPPGQASLPIPLVWNFTCEVGYWSATTGYRVSTATGSRNRSETPRPPANVLIDANETGGASGNFPSPPTAKLLQSTGSYSSIERPGIAGASSSSSSSDSRRAWMCDRISSLSLRLVRSSVNNVDAPDQVSVYREFEGLASQIGQTLTGPYQLVAQPYGVSGSTQLADVFIRANWQFQTGFDTYRVAAPLGGIYNPSGSTPTVPASRSYWYTNGKMTMIPNVEAEKLKLASQNISVKEIAVDGTETSFDVFGHAIPSTANLYSHCGCLV